MDLQLMKLWVETSSVHHFKSEHNIHPLCPAKIAQLAAQACLRCGINKGSAQLMRKIPNYFFLSCLFHPPRPTLLDSKNMQKLSG